MHVTIGHTTVMADLQLFGLPPAEGPQPQPDPVAAGLQRLSQLTQQVHYGLLHSTYHRQIRQAPGNLCVLHGLFTMSYLASVLD